MTITAKNGSLRIRQSLAFRKGFGTSRHDELCRVFGLIGCYEHTPHKTRFDNLDDLEASVRSRDAKVWDVLHRCRDILLEELSRARRKP